MRREAGFTLIELLVVLAIIGILAAIAIPMFAEYKTRSFNSRALSDLKSALVAEEAYYVSNESYLSCGAGLGTPCEGNLPGLSSLSDGVLLAIQSSGGGPIVLSAMSEGGEASLAAASCHMKGDSYYVYSATGTGIVERAIDNGSTCADTVETPPEDAPRGDSV